MSDLLILLVAGGNFFAGLVIGEYARNFLEEKNEPTGPLFNAENARDYLMENPQKGDSNA